MLIKILNIYSVDSDQLASQEATADLDLQFSNEGIEFRREIYMHSVLLKANTIYNV